MAAEPRTTGLTYEDLLEMFPDVSSSYGFRLLSFASRTSALVGRPR